MVLDHMILPCLVYQLKNRWYETSRVVLYKQQISHQAADDDSPMNTQAITLELKQMSEFLAYHIIAQLCARGKYWRIAYLSLKGIWIKSLDTKLVRKYW